LNGNLPRFDGAQCSRNIHPSNIASRPHQRVIRLLDGVTCSHGSTKFPVVLSRARLHPRGVGAIAPVRGEPCWSDYHEITACLRPGARMARYRRFTEALLERGVRESDLTLIEYGSDFMRLLQADFQGARDSGWMRMDGFPLSVSSHQPVGGAVVSGQPLSICAEEVAAILTAASASARREARLPVHLWNAVPGLERRILDEPD